MVCNIFYLILITIFASGEYSLVYPDYSIQIDKTGKESKKKFNEKRHAITEHWNGYLLDCRIQNLQAEITMSGSIIRSTPTIEGEDTFIIRPYRFGRENVMLEIPATIDQVTANDDVVRSIRKDFIEEYSISKDGLRQDFIIIRKPSGEGNVVMELEVKGAEAAMPEKRMKDAVVLQLASGRELNYHKLRVFDANGKKLKARFEKEGKNKLRVTVNDKGATYPIRIDPTISDADWISIGGGIPGISSVAYALETDSFGNLYAGGLFTIADDAVVNYIARWDGKKWSTLGGGMDNYVLALALDASGNLYAGGGFITAGGISVNNIARWDGKEWSNLGGGMDGTVEALALDGSGNLYAGGRFKTAGGISVNNIARWDGKEWSDLGGGIDGDVVAIVVDASGNLYAGGKFKTAGGISVNNIARWDGKEWYALSSGTNDEVFDLALDTFGNLYACGWFDTAGGIYTTDVAKWNGTEWSTLGSGSIGGQVLALTLDAYNNLYAGGLYFCISKWDGNTWHQMGDGLRESIVDPDVTSLTIDVRGNLYVSGNISSEEKKIINIAKRVNNGWEMLSEKKDYAFININSYNEINTLLVNSEGDLFIAGGFATMGGISANNIAKWDGSRWSALGSGTDYTINAIAMDASGKLYAGGTFDTAGGIFVEDHIAVWDGKSWNALHNPTCGDVNALAVDLSGNLYVGGSKSTPNLTEYVDKWDGQKWSMIDSGMNYSVMKFAVDKSGKLYAVGHLHKSDESIIIKWDGKSWESLGNQINGDVKDILVDDSGNIYVGGQFDAAGGVSVKNIAKWDGNSWSALENGINKAVYALALDSSGNLYAGGVFDTAGGVAAKNIAKWDGNSWSNLGSGTKGQLYNANDGNIYAMTADGSSSLYVGGTFIIAGGKSSYLVAQCKLDNTSVYPHRTIDHSKPSITFDSRTGLLRLSLQSATEVHYKIFTLDGRQISHGSKLMNKGNSTLRLKNAGKIARGTYVVKVNAGKESIRFRMMVER